MSRAVIVCLLSGALCVPLHGAQPEESAPAELSEIVVTGTRDRAAGVHGAIPVGVIGRADMDQAMARNLGDLLRDLPGVTTSGGPRQAAAKPNIRGLGEGRVVLRLDGARQNFQTRHRGQAFVDPLLLQQVEVLRGPASTLHGSGAIGGVVNVRTMAADDFLDPNERFGGRATTAYQDNERGRFGAVTLAARSDRFGLLGSLSRQQADDFKDGDGNRVDVTGHDGVSGLLKGHWDKGESGRLTLGYLDHEDDSRSFATADRATGTLIDRITRQRTTTLNYRHASDGWVDADVTVYHSDLELDERAVVGTDTLVNRLETLGLDVFNTTRLTWGDVGHDLVYGVEFYRDEQTGLANGAPRPQFANAEQETLGVFLQDRVALGERLELTLGMRHDRIRQSAERAGAENNTASSNSLLARSSYALRPGLVAHLSLGEAFRAPNLRELYIGGQHFPGNQYLPNPDLEPETSRNLEAGLTWARTGWLTGDDRLQARLGMFRNDVDGFIEQVVDNASNTTRFSNIDDARIEGVEASLDYDAPLWRARLFASRLRGDDRGTGLPLESIPADEIGLVGARRWLDGRLETGARVVMTAKQDRVPRLERSIAPTPDHTLVDLFATWWPTRALRLDLRVDNLTDESYRQHLSLINNPGRSARLQLSYRAGG